MNKIIKILLLTLIFSTASAKDKSVYMELEIEDDSYGIELLCKGWKNYLLKFKLKKNIIQHQDFHMDDFVSIETELYTIKPRSIKAKSKSDIEIYLNESEFRKLGKSGTAKIYTARQYYRHSS